jgi:hypothetical protein
VDRVQLRLVAVTVWRILVAGVAWYGFDQVTGVSHLFTRPLPSWEVVGELSQLASLLVAVSYLGLAVYRPFVGGRDGARSAWLRGALAVLMWLVSLTAILVFDNHGQLGVRGFFFEHLVTPVLVTIDVVAIGRRFLRWWYPWTWIGPPAAYFGYLATNGFDTYPGLFDPADPTRLAVVAVAFLGLVVASGYVLCGLAKLRAYPADRRTSRTGETAEVGRF